MFGGVNRARRCRCGLILIVNFSCSFFLQRTYNGRGGANLPRTPKMTKQSIN